MVHGVGEKTPRGARFPLFLASIIKLLIDVLHECFHAYISQ